MSTQSNIPPVTIMIPKTPESDGTVEVDTTYIKDYYLSLDNKIAEPEGQCIKDWFKNELGALNLIEFQARVKGLAGRVKGKFSVAPTGKGKLDLTEEAIISGRMEKGIQALFKFKHKLILVQMDYGVQQLYNYWINPYLILRQPRIAGSTKDEAEIGFGAAFLIDQSQGGMMRYQSELSLAFNDYTEHSNIYFKQNLAMWHKQFIYSMVQKIHLGRDLKAQGKFSLSYFDGPLKSYVGLDMGNDYGVSNLGFGVSYKNRPDLKLFFQALSPFKWDSLPKYKDIHPNNLDIRVGADYLHSSGFGLKLGYFHRKKIASVLNFNINKYFTGSLLLDVRRV